VGDIATPRHRTRDQLFGRFVKTATGELPYPVFAYAGMVVWQLFSQAVIDASNSLIVNERLVTKVYFPRVLLPLSSVIGCLLDFSISLLVLGGFVAWFHVAPQPSLLLIPIFALLAAAAAFGAGLWLSALNVKYRDVRYTLTFIIQFWFFVTPIAYPSSAVPARWLRLYALNPMVGIVDGFRWAIHGSGAVSLEELGLSIGTIAILLVGGLLYFGRAEDTFADFI
jgi:lipopolysaccharide transport system permease protein